MPGMALCLKLFFAILFQPLAESLLRDSQHPCCDRLVSIRSLHGFPDKVIRSLFDRGKISARKDDRWGLPGCIRLMLGLIGFLRPASFDMRTERL